jgi:DNA replication ATP-dependent helicase Dna2
MIHEVMQSCLIHRKWNERWIEEKIEDILSKGLGELVKIGVSVDEGRRELRARAKGLKGFSEKYISQIPKVCLPPPLLWHR